MSARRHRWIATLIGTLAALAVTLTAQADDSGVKVPPFDRVMLDNGAFPAWTKGKPVDWPGFVAWAKPYLEHQTTWAVIPDVIDGTEEDNDCLIAWLFNHDREVWRKSAPVWHMHESIDRLKRLCAGFPRVRAFIDRTLAEARRTGVVKTMYGRRRLVPELNSRDFQRRSAAEREAINTPIQGTAGDIMKRSMLLVHEALAADPEARMILTVHDELLFEVPVARVDALASVIRERMESAAELKVPLTVDVGIGPNWKDAKH